MIVNAFRSAALLRYEALRLCAGRGIRDSALVMSTSETGRGVF